MKLDRSLGSPKHSQDPVCLQMYYLALKFTVFYTIIYLLFLETRYTNIYVDFISTVIFDILNLGHSWFWKSPSKLSLPSLPALAITCISFPGEGFSPQAPHQALISSMSVGFRLDSETQDESGQGTREKWKLTLVTFDWASHCTKCFGISNKPRDNLIN